MTSIDEPVASDGAPSSAPPPAPEGSGRYATKAVLALVLGAASLLLLLPAALLALLTAVAAVILGHLAVREVRSTGERGHAVAVGGLVAGWLTIGLAVLVLILAIAVRTTVTVGNPGDPAACTSTTGDFSQKQLQACFDQTNGD